MAGNQGQLETISEKLDPSVQMEVTELANSGPFPCHMEITSMQNSLEASRISCPVSTTQQISASDMETRFLNPMSSYLGSQLQPTSIKKSGKIEFQNHSSLKQPYLVPYDPSGEARVVLSNLDQQVSGKRKSLAEPMASVAVQNILVPKKRTAHMEHRPWLQPISQPSKAATQMQTFSVSPRMQYLPTLSKKTVQLEHASGKSGKQVTGKIQYAQKKPLPNPHNESYESVRSKLRESLAGALALVQQQGESSNEVKISQSGTASSPPKTSVSSLTVESASAASGADAAVSDGTFVALRTSDGCSIQNGCSERIGSKTSDTKHCDTQESEFIYPFPHEEVPFGGNIFAKDDLLQGNGLSWVLDSEIEFVEKKETETAETQISSNADEGITNKKSLQDPQFLAYEIEAELFKLFRGVNKKYKEKGRSLLFNLKDKNNPELREKVMYGEIPPERLCSMSAEELASKELSEWRQAKAEELAQMVILPDTQVDIRRLVRKTHKGEFQVEVEPVDSGSVEVSVGSTSFTWSQLRNNKKESSSIGKTLGKRNEVNNDQGIASTITIPSNEGTVPMQGITVDDDMKDVTGFLPPIVSLDEFMESLNSEPPSSTDAGKSTPQPDNIDVVNRSDSKSPQQALNDHVGAVSDVSKNSDFDSSKTDADVISKTASSVVIPTGERIWEGVFQLSVSSVTSVIGIFRSGEKTNAKEWPVLLEVKGRVRQDAFEKFLRELRNSRSRAVMVVCFVSTERSPKSEHSSLSEVAESYVRDERVGYAEPGSGVELYLCPPNGKTPEIISKIVPKDQLDFFKSLDNGLVGIVVWRKRPQSTSIVSPNSASRHKHGSQSQQQSVYRKQHQENDSTMNVYFTASTRSTIMTEQRSLTQHDDDANDDDVPPGFGPGRAQEDDDLPEFNFSSGGPLPAQTSSAQSQSMDQVRELIHKYGKPKLTWNRDGDDDDDIPEWQPQAQPNPLSQPGGHLLHHYETLMHNQSYGSSRPATNMQPQHRTVSQQGGWSAHQPAGQYHGTPPAPPGLGAAQPRSKGF